MNIPCHAGELVRVQREREKTPEGVSECEGRRGGAREVAVHISYYLVWKREARACIYIIYMYLLLRRLKITTLTMTIAGRYYIEGKVMVIRADRVKSNNPDVPDGSGVTGQWRRNGGGAQGAGAPPYST